MFTLLERVISAVSGAVSLVPFLRGLVGRSLRAYRKELRKQLSAMRADGFRPDLMICLGRGGYFIGSLLVDEIGRTIPLLGIDKSYYGDGGSGVRRRQPCVEVPESFRLSNAVPSPSILLVTGEIVDGESMLIAAEFVVRNVPGCVLKTFSLYWNHDSSFKPDYIGHQVAGRQSHPLWKKKEAPDYLTSRWAKK